MDLEYLKNCWSKEFKVEIGGSHLGMDFDLIAREVGFWKNPVLRLLVLVRIIPLLDLTAARVLQVQYETLLSDTGKLIGSKTPMFILLIVTDQIAPDVYILMHRGEILPGGGRKGIVIFDGETNIWYGKGTRHKSFRFVSEAYNRS